MVLAARALAKDAQAVSLTVAGQAGSEATKGALNRNYRQGDLPAAA